MPTDLSLSLVISQVLSHTPTRVWVILALITALGIRQTVGHVMPSRRLAIAPVVLGSLSLWSAASAFGMHAEVFAAWVIGAALAVLASQWLAPPAKAQYLGAGRYAVQGSFAPLLAMWSVFAVRYATAVTLVLHPGWAHGTLFSVAMPMVYGALSGLFMARSLRILRTGQSASTLSLA